MSWTIQSQQTEKQRLAVEESLFFTGNGYIGVRGNFEETNTNIPSIRGTYINGFHNEVDITYGEKMPGFPDTKQTILNIMDTQSIHIWLGDDPFSLEDGKIISYERTLDLKKGLQLRHVHWCSPSGHEVKITFKRLASFVHKHLFVQEITLTPVHHEIPVRIATSLNGNVRNFFDPNDPRVAAVEKNHLERMNSYVNSEGQYMELKTSSSGLSVAALATFAVKKDGISYQHKNDKSELTSTTDFLLDQETTIEKRTIFVDSIRFRDLEKEVLTLVNELTPISFATLCKEQEAYLDRFWQHTDVTISGDDQLQEAIRFNLFHMLQSTGQDGITNIAAKGLSGEGYEGHYFWDSEVYVLPIYTLTNPDLAKNLLLYRYAILDEARRRAREMGHRQGALFPWRTINGKESSAFFPAGTAQYHISADIAHSYVQYYLATGDIDFMKDAGVEVLLETARLWMDVGHFYQGTFRIDAVTGPDEYTCIVNNNYYTNVMAKQNLLWAKKAWERLLDHHAAAAERLKCKIGLRDEEITQFEQAGKSMYLPVDETLRINPQDDTFLQKAKWDFNQVPKNHYPLLLHYHPLTIYRYQVCKQADTVLAHLLAEDEQSEEVMKNSFHYYEAITTHDSSLSSCVHGMMAARIGEMDKAYDYFIQSARLDLDNLHGNTKDGLHMANMGGTWMGIIVGFAGMRLKEGGLYFNPQLPHVWEKYRFQFNYQGSLLQCTITKNNCSIDLLQGKPVTLHIYGDTYTVTNQVKVQHRKGE